MNTYYPSDHYYLACDIVARKCTPTIDQLIDDAV